MAESGHGFVGVGERQPDWGERRHKCGSQKSAVVVVAVVVAVAVVVVAAGEEVAIQKCCGRGSCGFVGSSCPGTLNCSDGTSKHAQFPYPNLWTDRLGRLRKNGAHGGGGWGRQ